MDNHFELQVHSIAVWSAWHWALYAVPASQDEEIQRVECHSREELDVLLTRLRRIGVSERALVKARKSITERNVSLRLGTFDLSPVERGLLQLEPVSGFRARDANHLSLIEYEEAQEEEEEEDRN
jgi:hypothetical protein